MLTVPTRVIADEVAPPGPKTTMTEAERDEFLDFWMDVFARGTRSLNDTPESYDFDGALKQSLVDDLIVRLKNDSPDIARQFDPAVAGPMFGVSTLEDPLHAPDGTLVTQEFVDRIYASFIGAIIFDREAFIARLSSMLDPLTPDESAVPPPADVGPFEQKDEIRSMLEAEPLFEWANDIPDAAPPAEFVAQAPPAMADADAITLPTDLTRDVSTSPFNAAPASAWLDPEFHLALPNLLNFLATLTGLETDDLLSRLGLVAGTAGHFVETIEGTLDEAFPGIAAPIHAMGPIAEGALDAVVALEAPVPLQLKVAGPDADLPPEADEAIARAATLAAGTQYAIVLNGQSFEGTWEAPLLVDLDHDGAPDALLHLTLAVPTIGVGDIDVEKVPLFTLERIDAVATVQSLQGTAVAIVAPDLAAPELPGSALDTLQLALAYTIPATGETVAYVANVEGGIDHLEVSLTSTSPSVAVKTAGGDGAFELAAAVVDGDRLHMVTIAAPMPPTSATVDGSADAASGLATLAGDVTATGPVALAAIDSAPGSRLALGVWSGALAPFQVTSAGSALDVTARAGSALTIERQEGVAGSSTTFRSRSLDIIGAPGSLDATLADDALDYHGDAAGASLTMLVADVSDGAIASGAWVQVDAAGRRAGLSLADGGVEFTSDRTVELVRAVRAGSAGAALVGEVPAGMLYATDDLFAYSLEGARSASATPDSGGFAMEMVSESDGGFLVYVARAGDFQQYYLSNIPHQASFDVSPTGLSVGASEMVSQITGYLVRQLDEGTAPTTTVLVADNVVGTAAVTMDDAAVNTFLTGSIGDISVMATNVVIGRGVPVFAALPGQHTFAQVDGLLHQQSAGLTNAAGSITGGLFGPLSTISIQMSIAGELCQQFGHDGKLVKLCISNVPSSVTLALQALPSPTIVYDASAIIDSITLQVIAPDVDALFSILQIPKHVQLTLAASQMVLSTDTRLGGLTFDAALGTTTLGAGLLDLPKTLTLTWGNGGVTPAMPANDAIGRVYFFVSKPGLAFDLDIVHLPPSVLTWSSSSFAFGPAGTDRIGSAIVQLIVGDLQFVTQANGIPGMSASWSTAGGALSTTGTLDGVSISLTKGTITAPTVQLTTSLVGVPKLTASWATNAMGLTLLAPGKITSLGFTFRASDLLLSLSAQGVPTTTLTMGTGGFTVSAPGAIDLITLVLAKGPGFYDPNTHSVDFAGVYLRPDLGRFGISARVSGIKSASYSKNDALKTNTISVGFTTDKTFQAIVDMDSVALTAYADLWITNLAATTTFTVGSEGVTLSGTPINTARSGPWLQATVNIGTPAAYAATPDPRWPWQTTGASSGIMGNTMVDTTIGGVATKWRVYTPLPNAINFAKVTSDGMPTSYSLSTGSSSLGKLDIRTNLKVNLNTCGACTPTYLNTLAVATVSNLPTSLSVSEGLGTGASAGSPAFTINTGQSINKLFLGLRFDGAWYSTGDETGGFPIYGSLSQIPTSVSLAVSKAGGWGAGNTPSFSYAANANTLDASLFLDVGLLWNMFAKTTIQNAAAAGRQVPGWLVGLANMNAQGHLLAQITDIPAAGIAMYRSGQNLVVDPLGSVPLTKLFIDFNLRFEKSLADSGCWICGTIQLDWFYNFGYWWEISQLSLMLENLRYVSIDPAIESIIVLDGHMVFNFMAQAGIWFNAGITLTVNVVGLSFQLLCICVPSISLSAMIDPGFISFQVHTYTWSVNYITPGFFCHFFEPWYEPWAHAWCETHYYVGVTYTIPDTWSWDLPIAYPPYVPFRGLNLNTGTTHVFLDPRVLNCSGSFCWEVARLIPVSLIQAYAFLKYVSISGPNWWDVSHDHWF
ncbi:MAG TPA: hypothetical protein VM370_09670 [Candidatus Thermoplasmatota archaeon]|nr:hypothetical protein [Candidatus Thermoplasmatota archaeon]